jgi:hypothetical protein
MSNTPSPFRHRRRRNQTPSPPRRRGRTRWLLITPIVVLSLIVLGVVALEAAAPQVDTSDLVVEDLPPLALEDGRSCTRQTDDTTTAEIRAEVLPGARVSSTQVFRCPAAYDGLEVSYAGEVIGEVLPRAGGAWAQVNDDVYALRVGPLVGHRELEGFNTGLSVWLPDGLHEQIEEAGRPGRRGDVILIRGTLLRTDPDDGAGLTIRAQELQVVAPSVVIEEPLHVPQLIVAILLAILAVTAIAWSRVVARRL